MKIIRGERITHMVTSNLWVEWLEEIMTCDDLLVVALLGLPRFFFCYLLVLYSRPPLKIDNNL